MPFMGKHYKRLRQRPFLDLRHKKEVSESKDDQKKKAGNNYCKAAAKRTLHRADGLFDKKVAAPFAF